MYLSSLAHRDRLFDIATRWFADEVAPEDGRHLTEIFAFESLISGPPVRRFLIDMLTRIHGVGPRFQRICVKDDLRRAIIAGCPRLNQRAEMLFRHYHETPEEFFPRTPVDLILAFGEGHDLLGMSRIKRIRRIAEKASRRVADRLAGAINWHARALANRRAQQAGLAVDQLVSPPETMSDEFARAERTVSLAFRDRRLRFAPLDLQIDDVIGFKLVGTREQLERVPDLIAEQPGAEILEREEHSGTYNAVNLIVELTLPDVDTIAGWMAGRDWTFAVERGLAADTLTERFREYVATGARTICAEVILTTYDELIESEFGRCIHEQRILQQRTSAPYSGRIATNASYIIEYMLMLAISPRIQISEVPVKMWGHYLPDTLSTAVWNLFSLQNPENLCDVLTLVPDEVYTVLDLVFP